MSGKAAWPLWMEFRLLRCDCGSTKVSPRENGLSQFVYEDSVPGPVFFLAPSFGCCGGPYSVPLCATKPALGEVYLVQTDLGLNLDV